MWKRLYFYICKDCKKKRQTIKEERSVEKVCRKCVKARVDPNQKVMF